MKLTWQLRGKEMLLLYIAMRKRSGRQIEPELGLLRQALTLACVCDLLLHPSTVLSSQAPEHFYPNALFYLITVGVTIGVAYLS